MLCDWSSFQPSTNACCTLSKSFIRAFRTCCPASPGVRPNARAVTHSPSLAVKSSSAVRAMFPLDAVEYSHVIFLLSLMSCQPSLTPTYPQLIFLNAVEQARARETPSLREEHRSALVVANPSV